MLREVILLHGNNVLAAHSRSCIKVNPRELTYAVAPVWDLRGVNPLNDVAHKLIGLSRHISHIIRKSP